MGVVPAPLGKMFSLTHTFLEYVAEQKTECSGNFSPSFWPTTASSAVRWQRPSPEDGAAHHPSHWPGALPGGSCERIARPLPPGNLLGLGETVVFHEGAELVLVEGGVEDEDFVQAAAEEGAAGHARLGGLKGEVAAQPHVVG